MCFIRLIPLHCQINQRNQHIINMGLLFSKLWSLFGNEGTYCNCSFGFCFDSFHFPFFYVLRRARFGPTNVIVCGQLSHIPHTRARTIKLHTFRKHPVASKHSTNLIRFRFNIRLKLRIPIFRAIVKWKWTFVFTFIRIKYYDCYYLLSAR